MDNSDYEVLNVFEDALSECEDLINSSVVSDVVSVNVEELKKLGAYSTEMSAGMLITDTVPITDMEIKMFYPEVGMLTARFVVEPTFANIINNIDDYKDDEGRSPEAILAMAITLQINKGFKRSLLPVMVIVRTGGFAIPPAASLINGDGKAEHFALEKTESKLLSGMAYEALQTWYFIQVCLTNPPIRERFAALSGIEARPRKEISKKKRSPVRYVRTHILDPEKLGIIKKSESGRTYSCLAWYVVGHWREYKNGHRVFIKPYWKGTMRNKVKDAGDVSRNRIIVQMDHPDEARIPV